MFFGLSEDVREKDPYDTIRQPLQHDPNWVKSLSFSFWIDVGSPATIFETNPKHDVSDLSRKLLLASPHRSRRETKAS